MALLGSLKTRFWTICRSRRQGRISPNTALEAGWHIRLGMALLKGKEFVEILITLCCTQERTGKKEGGVKHRPVRAYEREKGNRIKKEHAE